jgi:hypothetical protein
MTSGIEALIALGPDKLAKYPRGSKYFETVQITRFKKSPPPSKKQKNTVS